MGIEKHDNPTKNNFFMGEDSKEEEEVDIESKLLIALEELKKYKKKTKSLKGQLLEFEEAHKSREREISKTVRENEQIIIELNIHIQEAKRIEEVLTE
jgi:hypothetical protein